MKIKFQNLLILVVFSFPTSPVFAGDSVEASLQALGYSIEAGFKMVSAAAAIPLVSVGEIGAVSGEIGNELMEEAATPPGQRQVDRALPVTDEVITAGPKPAVQMEQHE